MQRVTFQVTLDIETAKFIDRVRGFESRSHFCRRLIKDGLEKERESPNAMTDRGTVPHPTVAR